MVDFCIFAVIIFIVLEINSKILIDSVERQH